MTTPTYAQLQAALQKRLQNIGLQVALHENTRPFGPKRCGLVLYADLLGPALSAAELASLDREAGSRTEHRLRARGHRVVDVGAAAWVLPLIGGAHAVVFAEGRGLNGLRISGVESDVGMTRSKANARIDEWLDGLAELVGEAAVS